MWWLLVMRVALCAGVPPLPDEHARRAKSAFDNFHEHYLTPDDFVLAEHTPVARPTPAELDAVQNSQLFEGDIAGVPEDAIDPINRRMRDDVMLDEDAIFSKPYHSSLNLATYPDKLWTEGQVPYMLEEGMTAEQRAAIAQAFDEYKQKTCIRFVPRDDDDFDYIYVKRNVAFGCSSYVGRAGGNQTVSLEVDKCFSKGIIAHELMHALGFFHEHSRTDRDQFVDIQEDNIRPGMMRNFEKYPKKIIDPLGMPYDYESVMHYHKLAFSRNGKATIEPHDKNAEVGQRYRLSPIDAKKVNKLYQCGEFAKTTTTTTTTTTEQPTTTTTTEEEEVEESTVAATRRTTTRRPRTKPTKHTKHTTRTTTQRPTTTSTQRPKSRKRCEDLNAHCEMWSQLGHCEHSLKYMSHYCPKSCGHCGIQEKEKETNEVSEEKKSGEKEKGKDKKPKGIEGRGGNNIKDKTTPLPVSTTRKPSEKCADKNLFCGYWAKIGECKSDSKFMKIFCKHSCGQC